MPFVAKPDRFSSDALIPGKVTDERGFVTENVVIEGARGPITLYYSASGIRQMAQRYPQLGLVDKIELDRTRDLLAEAHERIAALSKQVEDMADVQERIAGLRKAGFTVQKKPGAPQKKNKEDGE